MMDGSQVIGYDRPADEITLPRARRRRWWLKRLLIVALSLMLIAAAALYGNYYWTTGSFLVSTDDAYVQAHSVLISPKVSGYSLRRRSTTTIPSSPARFSLGSTRAIIVPRSTRRGPVSGWRKRAWIRSTSRSRSRR
jgi:hypothetical protein